MAGEPAYVAPALPVNTLLHQQTNYDPVQLLHRAVSYGDSVWQHISSLLGTGATLAPFLNLSYIIEDHIDNLFQLCSTRHLPPSTTLGNLSQFYQSQDFHYCQYRINLPSLSQQLHSKKPASPFIRNNNYYDALPEIKEPFHTISFPLIMSSSANSTTPETHATKSFFVEDLHVSEISDIVRNQMENDHQTQVEHEGVEATNFSPATANLQLETPVSQRMRINLIRHRYARSSEMTTLKLFKSFILTLKKVDKNIVVLPYDSKKQQYTSLVSLKQIEHLNDHQLKLYFTSWFKEQHYSLSGFFHFSTMSSFEELLGHPLIVEWLDTYQYSVKLCPSQAEEMAIVGALCYGSTWIFREDLKLHIMEHQTWQTVTQTNHTPVIFDLSLRTFKGSKENVQMIFVSAERSKQDLVREAFKSIYDGTAKSYPRGEMLYFIPVRMGEQYTTEQRDKFVFNHETYLGEEEVTAIHGLQDLNSTVTLKGGKSVTIRTLIKSLPATQGMSRNRLFQVVDPNAGQTCTIVTFQKSDKHFIEQRKFTLEKELRAILAPGESSKLFVDDVEGIWFGGNARKKNGKTIALTIPNKSDIDYITQTNSILNNPPPKRPHDINSGCGSMQPPTHIAYRGVVQASHTQTTQSVSVNDTEGTTTTTTTQTSQTVTAMMEARFQTIETEIQQQKTTQQHMDQRLHTLEHRTTSIDDNIAEMMAFWKITPSQKRKAGDNPPLEYQRDYPSRTDPHLADIDMDGGTTDQCL